MELWRLLPGYKRPFTLLLRWLFMLRRCLVLVFVFASWSAHADVPDCVRTESLDKAVLAELPKSWRRPAETDVLAVKGFRTHLMSQKCWRQTWGPDRQFESSGHVTIYLMPMRTVAGFCRAEVESFVFENGHWSSARAPHFAASIGPADCQTHTGYVDIYQLIEDFSLQALLVAEDSIYQMYTATVADPEPRRPLESVRVEAEDNHVYFVLKYGISTCVSSLIYVEGTTNGGFKYAHHSIVMC